MAVAASQFAAPGLLPGQLSRLRQSRCWTLAELAERTGLSRPYLSRLEAGQRQPSLAALISLAKTYETPLQALLDPAAATAMEPIVVRGKRATIQRGNGLHYRPISRGEGGLLLNALHVTVPHRRRSRAFSQHEGEELLYVLGGTLVLTLNRQSHTLVAGDSAHFDSMIPHRVTAAGERDAQVLLVSCAPPSVSHQDLQPTGAPGRIARSGRRKDSRPQLCAASPVDEAFASHAVKS